MELLVLISLVSLVSARCNKILPSGCGQIPDFNVNLNVPYAIFNSGGNGFRQPYITGTSGSSQSGTCLGVDVIPITLKQVLRNQPLYTRIVENTPQFRRRDSTCATFFPVPGDEKSLILYLSIVYLNGFNDITSFLITEVAPGVFAIANAEYTISIRFFASIGDSLLMSCTRTEFGDSNFPEKIVISQSSLNPLGLSCLQQIQQIFDCNGLSEYDGMYVLPNRLPLRCYTQQTCFSDNPFTPPFRSRRG